MICPKCKVEYREGFTECIDCHIDLVKKKGTKKHMNKVSQQGLSMLRFGTGLLFVCMFEFMTLITLYDTNFAHKIFGDSPSGIFGIINPFVRILLAVQFIISLLVMLFGFCSKERD